MSEDRRERDDWDDDYANRPRRRKPAASDGSGVKVVLIILGVVGLLGVLAIAAFIGLMMYATTKVRTAAVRIMEQNEMKEIGLALHSYHDANGSFPPAAFKTRDGKPGLSWRVAILPYLEQEALFRQFKLDEPWDSPNNLPLLNQMPRQFARPNAPSGTTTHIRVFVGPGTAFDPAKKMSMAKFLDGTANTLLVVEAADAVPWTKPDDLNYAVGGALPALGSPERDHVLVLMADGSVRPVSKKASSTSWHAAIGVDDGQVPGADF